MTDVIIAGDLGSAKEHARENGWIPCGMGRWTTKTREIVEYVQNPSKLRGRNNFLLYVGRGCYLNDEVLCEARRMVAIGRATVVPSDYSFACVR